MASAHAGDSSLASTAGRRKKGPFLSIGGGSPARAGVYEPGPSALTPAPHALLPAMRLHPEGPRGSASIRASPARPMPPAPGLRLLTPAPFQGLEAREPGAGARFRTEPALSSRGANAASPVAPPQGSSESSPLRTCTPDLPRPGHLSFPHHGPCQEANGSTGTEREQLGPPPPSPPPPGHIIGLRRQRGLQATAAADGLHLLGPALPVVASRAVETVGPPGNYNSRGASRACVLA